jgi:hypothetical protein
VIFEARTTNIDDLLALLPDVLIALEVLKPADVVRVGTDEKVMPRIAAAGPA